MAQDFNALIDGLGGEGEDYINTLDADGVALAAIQGLYQLSQEQATRIEELETENAALQQQMDNLETRVAALEAGRCPEPVEEETAARPMQAGLLSGAGVLFLTSLALGLLVRRGGVLRL